MMLLTRDTTTKIYQREEMVTKQYGRLLGYLLQIIISVLLRNNFNELMFHAERVHMDVNLKRIDIIFI